MLKLEFMKYKPTARNTEDSLSSNITFTITTKIEAKIFAKKKTPDPDAAFWPLPNETLFLFVFTL